MSLSPGDQAQILGIGGGALLVVGAGIFKASSLEGDVNSKWAARVALALSALDEKLVSALEGIRDAVDALLPADQFDPTDAIADPAPLAKRAENASEFRRARVRMEGDLALLRRLCPVLTAALAVLWVAIAAGTADYGELVRWAWLRTGALILGGLMVLVLVVASLVYATLQHRVARAEVLADTGGRVDFRDGG